MPIILDPVTPATGSVLTVDMVTSSFAQTALSSGNTTLSTYQSTMLPTWITAASKEIVRYCNRVFTLTTYDEIVTPEGGRQDRGEPATAKLSSFPVQSITRAYTGRQQSLTILNTQTATNQIAYFTFVTTGDVEYFDLTYTGLTFTTVASGVTNTSTLLFSSYPTIQSLATAINGLGNGWSTQVASQTALYPSADLVGAREPKDAIQGSSGLDVFTQVATSYDIDRSTGIVRFYGLGGAGMMWGTGFGIIDPAFDGLSDYSGNSAFGWSQYRFTYTAGWATVPEPLQIACCEVVRAMLDVMKISSAMQSQSAESTGSWAAREAMSHLPDWVYSVLNQYKDFRF